jgi:hypothetical protein
MVYHRSYRLEYEIWNMFVAWWIRIASMDVWKRRGVQRGVKRRIKEKEPLGP